MEIDYLNELKNDESTGLMIENNQEKGYKIRIVYRGEGLFYHDLINNVAFICDIDIRNSSIFTKTIKKWDNGSNIVNKEEIVERIEKYFVNYQKVKPEIIN